MPKMPGPSATLEELEGAYNTLLSSWEFAFAMGSTHSGPGADHPLYQATRQRASDLRARISEMKA